MSLLSTFVLNIDISMRAEWKRTGISLIKAPQLSNGLTVSKYDDAVYIVTDNMIRFVNSTSINTDGFVMTPIPNDLRGLLNPTDVLLHESSNSLVVCSSGNRRLMRWSLELDKTEGKAILDNIDCFGLASDDESTLYISDLEKHEIIKYNTAKEQKEIVAGGNGKGKGLHRLNLPTYIALDHHNTLYVSDTGNHRVMKWTTGAERGIIVAGHERHGNQLNQLNTPSGLVLNEKNNSIIICDYANRRVMQWSLQRHTTEGEMLLNDIDCLGLAMDDESALYVSDIERHEIIMYVEGTSKGISVAGGDGPGNSLDQLSFPHKVTIDSKGGIYVPDFRNHRVVRWAKDKKEGTVMASYRRKNSLSNYITDILLYENLLILCDSIHKRIIKSRLHDDLTHYSVGDEILTDTSCRHLARDNDGALYVIPDIGDEIRRYPKGSTTGISVSRENTEDDELQPLGQAFSVTVDNDGTLYILNHDKHVVRLKNGEQETIIRASKEDYKRFGFSFFNFTITTDTFDTIEDPTAIIFDVTDNSLVICDEGNNKLTRWSLQINSTKGKTITALSCKGLVTDNKGTLYISNTYLHEIQRYNPASDELTTLARWPSSQTRGFFTVDDNDTVYFSDENNNYVMVLMKDGTKDILFANQQTKLFVLNSLDNPTKLLYDKRNDAIIICDCKNRRVVRWSLNPYTTRVEELIKNINCISLAIDSGGAVYVTITGVHEVRRYFNGSTNGMAVAGGNKYGNGLHEFHNPSHIVLDNEDTLFVVDTNNQRIMRWNKGAREGIVVVNLGRGPCGVIKVVDLLYDAKANALIVCDPDGLRVLQFSLEPNKTTCQVLIYSAYCGGLAIDDKDALYVTIPHENQVRKYVNRSRYSTIVAGGNQYGNGLHQLYGPTHVALDGRGDLLVSDTLNNRIVQWKKGAISGQIILNPGRPYAGYSQLEHPTDILYDKNTNSIIVCDSGHQRIVQWFLEHLTIRGQDLINTLGCHGLAMDYEDTLYFSIPLRNEIRRYVKENKTGTIVAGGNGKGSDLHQLNNPTYICVDSEGSLFISDTGNDRVMQWKKGANAGIIIAGHGGYGNQVHQLNGPVGIVLHTKSNSIFICDENNRRVMRWSLQNRTTVGIPVINNISCFGIAVDDYDTLYITDHCTVKQYPDGHTQFNSLDCTADNWHDVRLNSYNKYCCPSIISVDSKGMMYVLDIQNRVALMKMRNATDFHIVAGHQKKRNQLNQLNEPKDVLFDRKTHSILVCDSKNHRVMRWTLANDTNEGIEVLRLVNCEGMAIDKNGALYVRNIDSHNIKRYSTDSVTGMVVASKNGRGNGLHQFDQFTSIAVDSEGAIYVSDSPNHRVMKWTRGAQEGIVVAGGHGKGDSLTHLNFPKGVIVDQLGTVYVADTGNRRIMRWPRGATQGSVIIDGSSEGKNPEQIMNPHQLSFDRYGNLYVYDAYYHRVSRFDLISPKENKTNGEF